MKLLLGICAAVILLTSCAPTRYPAGHQSAPVSTTPNQPVLGAGGVVKRGKPYQIAGKWYYPLASGAKYSQTGIASWYGKKFHGRKTANGETYNMYAMTAAHTVLPMPSIVRVTNLNNGKSIKVRVNDRGPFVKGRLIDLSYAAAKALGYAEQGTTRVRVQTLDVPAVEQPKPAKRPSVYTQFIKAEPVAVIVPVPMVEPKPAVKAEPIIDASPVVLTPEKSPKMAYVQVGAFGEERNAVGVEERLKEVLNAQHPPLKVVRVGEIYRVRVGPFDLDSDAMSALNLLQSKGYDAAMIIHD